MLHHHLFTPIGRGMFAGLTRGERGEGLGQTEPGKGVTASDCIIVSASLSNRTHLAKVIDSVGELIRIDNRQAFVSSLKKGENVTIRRDKETRDDLLRVFLFKSAY